MNRVIKLRRELHKIPELGFEEFKTSEYLRNILTENNIPFNTAKTGTVAYIDSGKPGKYIAIRADIDALPIEEINNVDYKSTHKGRMHACGHDANTATVLDAAIKLNSLNKEGKLVGKIAIVFQPGEEGYLGGKFMAESGLLDGIEYIYGAHTDPNRPTGEVLVLQDYAYAGVSRLKLKILGKEAHSADAPEKGSDAALAVSDLIIKMHTILSRGVKQTVGGNINIGKIDTIKGASNVIASEIDILGTVRHTTEENKKNIYKRIKAIIKGVEETWGVKIIDESPKEVLPAFFLDKAFSAIIKLVIKKTNYFDNVYQNKGLVTYGGEDMTFYSSLAPVGYYQVGIYNQKLGAINGLHTNNYTIDETVLEKVSDSHVAIAMQLLKE